MGMFDLAKGLFNPNKDVNIDRTIRNSDSTITKLGKIKTDGAVGHIGNINETLGTLKNTNNAYTDALRKGVGIDDAKVDLRKANKDAIKAIRAGNSHVRGAAYYKTGQKLGRFFTNKFVAIPTLAAAGLATIIGGAAWIGSKRDEKARESQNELRDQKINSIQAENDAMLGANTMMGLTPVQGDHTARVLAARNGNMGVDVSNPAVSLPYEIARTQ